MGAKKEALKQTLGNLKAAVEDINTVLALKPPIKNSDNPEVLVQSIRGIASEILPEDALSDKTKAVLNDIGVGPWAEENDAPKDTTAGEKVPAKKEEVEKVAKKTEKKAAPKKTAPKKTAPKKTAPKKTAPKKTEKKAPAKKKEVTPKYLREHSVVDAITKKSATLAEIAKKANSLYTENGGKSNPKQSMHVLVIGLKFLEHAGVVKRVGTDSVVKA